MIFSARGTGDSGITGKCDEDVTTVKWCQGGHCMMLGSVGLADFRLLLIEH